MCHLGCGSEDEDDVSLVFFTTELSSKLLDPAAVLVLVVALVLELALAFVLPPDGGCGGEGGFELSRMKAKRQQTMTKAW